MIRQSIVQFGKSKKTVLTLLLVGASFFSAHAQMIAISEQDMRQTEGQGGADIALNLRWNLQSTSSNDSNNINNYTYSCVSGDDKWCRLGLTANNRYATNGNKEWLVFKKIQGAIEIPKLMLDAAPIQYTNNGSVVNAMAIQLGFDSTQPIKLRNLGFESLSLEADSASENNSANVPGYVAPVSKYASGTGYGANNAIAGSFDNGKETGFVGLRINADVAIGGTVKVFACPAGVC